MSSSVSSAPRPAAGAPEVSVVMSAFNDAVTLPAALESILSQQGVELEFIVVDDGSTDGSAAILDEAARKDARLKVVHRPNAGLTRALIAGCALASAPWIARQDADDVSQPGRLADDVRSGRVRKTRSGDRALGLYHAGCLLERADPAGARAYFRQALSADPLCARAWFKLLRLRRRG